MSRISTLVAALLAASLLGGCVYGRCCPQTAAAAPSPAPGEAPMTERPSAWYRGENGAETDLASMVGEWRDADVVAFGELHGNLVGAEAQLALLKALHGQGRPLALAMEFMERDTQGAVDAYLNGELTEKGFMKRARQSRAYPRTHGPLMEYCKAHGIPVIAANAPRRLVSGYRKQEKDYEGYLADLSEEDRGWLPEETSILEDAYRDRFMSFMGEAKGPSFFRAQSLWDDAMAEAMVDFRSEHPDHRIFFIVGAFHVEGGLGTISKYKLRRGKDDIRILVMEMDKDGSLPFRDEDLGKGDVVLKVPFPKKRERPSGPNPHAPKPKKGTEAQPKAPKPPDA